jgi:hypothetical protein
VNSARAAKECLLAIELEPEAPRVNRFGHQWPMRDVEKDRMKAFVRTSQRGFVVRAIH